MTQTNPWVVMKFGGTSVSTRANWDNITGVIQKYLAANENLIIVCSAPSQISNQLETLMSEAVEGHYSETLHHIRQCYRELANELKLDFDVCLAQPFDDLTHLVEGVSLVHEASFRVQAQIMAFGEILLTHLAVAFLESQGVAVQWQDARDWLLAIEDENDREEARYSAVRCQAEYDADFADQVMQQDVRVYVTQGFIAYNDADETVLLGRGGSDASAAYIAAQLGAARCEIWTDVPGIYTTNPKSIPQARLLTVLDYDEAQEIASCGGKILHPNCVGPLRINEIPLLIKYTPDPVRAGTLITRNGEAIGLPIKSVLTRHQITLVTIETSRMWQRVGFLADVFVAFKQFGFSIDLVGTSELSVTVSLDRDHETKDQRVLDKLLEKLNTFARAKVIGSCAAVTLIGHNMGSILHKLGEVFEVFDAQNIYLLSLAANDLNLTFVVDEGQAEKIAKKIHTLLIDYHPTTEHVSQSWQEEFGDKIERSAPWWQQKRTALLELAQKQSPLYVYSAASLQAAVDELKTCDALDQIYFAMKSNPHPDILCCFVENGLNIECVSLGEVKAVIDLFPDLGRQRILFTPNFAPREEYAAAFELGVRVTVDNIYQLRHWSDLFVGKEIIIRVDPGQGAGHHKYVHTAGAESKFGILISQLDELAQLVADNNTHVIGLHAHSGSGILTPNNWHDVAVVLSESLDLFPEVKFLNLGGGLGVVDRSSQQPLDMQAVNESLREIKKALPKLDLWMEPGRFLVARSGVILAKVTQTKRKGDMYYIGIETGMNSLIRPALYGSYHEIVNLSRFDDSHKIMANIVGPICESGDTLGYARLLPETQEGDVILIANAGAYGHCMSSSYNHRQPAAEIYLGA